VRRVTIEQLRTGDRLGRDVSAHPADELPLLRAGNRISDSQRASLQRAGVVAVWIEDALSDGIDPLEVLGDETRRRATAAVHEAFKNVAASLSNRAPLSAEVVMEMSKVAEWIIRDITRNIESALALNDLANADSYTLKHSLAVTTLGLALGLRVMHKFGWVDVYGRTRWDDIEDRLIPLAVGLLLHDIGTLAVPQEIMQKSGELTDEELAAVRMHPMAGVEILKKAQGISPLSRAVVRSHHERWDGSGYPEKKTGANIHQFARIAAVADVYDALTSDRYHRKARAAHDVHAFVVKRAGRDFDPQVVEVFRSFVAPYPPGTPVVLSDGYCGLVKEVRQNAVLVPVVRIIADPSGALIEPREVDLGDMPGVTIVSTDFAVPELVLA
jgi:HD-GYP domain-containing protein (c-di-GMP phosphodiesterase class II)